MYQVLWVLWSQSFREQYNKCNLNGKSQNAVSTWNGEELIQPERFLLIRASQK